MFLLTGARAHTIRPQRPINSAASPSCVCHVSSAQDYGSQAVNGPRRATPLHPISQGRFSGRPFRTCKLRRVVWIAPHCFDTSGPHLAARPYTPGRSCGSVLYRSDFLLWTSTPRHILELCTQRAFRPLNTACNLWIPGHQHLCYSTCGWPLLTTSLAEYDQTHCSVNSGP